MVAFCALREHEHNMIGNEARYPAGILPGSGLWHDRHAADWRDMGLLGAAPQLSGDDEAVMT